MSQRNVPIALLLEGITDNQQSTSNDKTPNTKVMSQSASIPNELNSRDSRNNLEDPNSESFKAKQETSPQNQQRSQPARPLQNLVSQFQTSVDMSPNSAQSPIIIDEVDDSPSGSEVVIVDDKDKRANLPMLPASFKKATSVAYQPLQMTTGKTGILDRIKNFQTSFKLGNGENNENSGSGTPIQPLAPWPQAIKLNPSKTSITSIINAEDESASLSLQEKKRKTQVKSEGPSKKAKPETLKKTNKNEGKQETTPASAPKKLSSKPKKRTPDISSLIELKPDKGPIHPTATTDKAKSTKQQPLLEKPSIVDVRKESPTSPEETSDGKLQPKDGPAEDKKEKQQAEMPVIALNIPLLDPRDPKPGQAEVVVNVLKLAEDKYGWNVIHPNAKSAIDLMDEMLEDEDDGADEDEDDDLQVVEDKGAPPQKKAEELTEEQRARKHETRMNRKVGKYDYEDPFIDDEELQWEEEITTTKEGFFVYWGPLVEDRSSTTTNKKGTSKGKK